MALLDKENNTYNYITYLLIGIGAYALLPFLLLTRYIHPTADDFWFAIRDTTLDFFSSQVHYYLNWSGRYFGTAIVRINPLTFNSFIAYKLYALALLLFLSLAVYGVLRIITTKALKPSGVLALASIILTLYFLQLPSPAESFYFFTTYITYQLPSVLLLIQLAIIYLFFNFKNTISKTACIGGATILCIFTVGSNEMALVITFTTYLLITVLNFKNKEAIPYLFFLLLVCIVCCLVAVLAPGNFKRMGEHPNASKHLWSVIYASFMTLLSFYRWLSPVLAITIVYINYLGIPLAEKLKHSRLFNTNILFIAFYFLATIFLLNFVFAWSTGERPTPRLENVIYFFFLFGWFYLLQVAITKYQKLYSSAHHISPVLTGMAMLIFVLNVFDIENNISTAYTDLISGKAAAYDNALDTRYASLKASDCKVCTVPPLPAIPKSIYFADIQEGPENNDMWLNRGFADYMKKTAVHLSEPNPPVLDNLATLRNTGKSILHKKKIIQEPLPAK